MNKYMITKGVQNGKPIPFPIRYEEIYSGTPYLKQQWEMLEEELLSMEPTETLDYAKFRLYWENGDRYTYQKGYYQRRKKVLVFALLAWRHPNNPIYLQELENILWEICSEPMWALPAHFMDKEDNDLPFSQYGKQIDLFASETALALAESLRLCGERLSYRCREFVKLQLEERILTPFLDGNQFYRFEIMKNNWSSVCGGAIGSVGILLLQDEERLINFLHRATSCIDIYLDSFGEDGACVEGVDYWSYGFGFFVCFADYLKQRTGGMVNYFEIEKVKKIALNQQVFYLCENKTISFSDGSGESRYRMGLSMYLKNQYPEMQIPKQKYAQTVLADTCYRFCLALRDILWFDEALKWEEEKKQSVWLEDAQWFISHGEIFALAAKGGNNGESHNHNDCGSFLLYKNGKPMLEDLGAGVYDRDYFSPKRYSFFVASSKSHNIPCIEGHEQEAGEGYSAKEVQVGFGESDTFYAELEDCYCCQSLQHYSRRIKHQKADNKVVLEEHFQFSKECKVTERFVSHSPIELQKGNASIRIGQETLQIEFDSNLEAWVSTQSYRNHKQEEHLAYILNLANKRKEKQLKFTIILQ